MTMEDPGEYFVEDEFAVRAGVALANGGTYDILGIFDKSYTEAPVGTIGIESTTPAFLTADAWIEPLAEGDILTIEETPYTVTDLQPDGTGHTLIVLDKRT